MPAQTVLFFVLLAHQAHAELFYINELYKSSAYFCNCTNNVCNKSVIHCVADDKSASRSVESPYLVLGRRKRKPPVPFFYDDKVNSAAPNWVRAALT